MEFEVIRSNRKTMSAEISMEFTIKEESANLKCKQTDFNLPLCQIEKVVKLTPSEYTEFVSNPLGYYDFLREFNAEKHEYSPDGIPCLLLIREGHNYAQGSKDCLTN